MYPGHVTVRTLPLAHGIVGREGSTSESRRQAARSLNGRGARVKFCTLHPVRCSAQDTAHPLPVISSSVRAVVQSSDADVSQSCKPAEHQTGSPCSRQTELQFQSAKIEGPRMESDPIG